MTDDLVKRLRDQWEATPPDICYAAADRIEQLEAAIMEISRINNRRDRFSSEIDAVIYKALESGND